MTEGIHQHQLDGQTDGEIKEREQEREKEAAYIILVQLNFEELCYDKSIIPGDFKSF